MAVNFVNILKHHFGTQLAAKLISFVITSYLIRHVSVSLIGLVNVRLTLLYTTIGFLAREPFHKLCLSSDISLKQSKNYALLSIPISILWTSICSLLWYFLPYSEGEYNDRYPYLILVFAGSALIEILVEPCVIYTLKTGDNKLYSYSKSILTLLQRLVVFVLVIGSKVDHLTAFCIAQLVASIAYASIYVFKWLKSNETFGELTLNFKSDEKLKLLKTLEAHSFLKQLLTDGAGYVMVSTNVLSLEMQGVYDTVDKLGSLVTRVILAPLEETAAIYFSTQMERTGVAEYNNKAVVKEVSRTYFTTLRAIINLGIVIITFGIPYSSLVLGIYGGSQIVENHGDRMLMLYLMYLLIMAINGITECFAFASMGQKEIMSHAGFMFAGVCGHFLLNIFLSQTIGAYGFIIANCINSAIRIAYNGHYILKFLKTPKSYLLTLLPSLKLSGMLVGSFIVVSLSYMIFGSAPPSDIVQQLAHVAVGGVLFLGVIAYMYQVEHVLSAFLFSKDRNE